MLSKKVFLSVVASSFVVSLVSANSVWIDNSVNAHPQDSIKIGNGGSVGAIEAIAIGSHADANSNYSTSVGRYSQSASRGTAIGGDSQATDGATAVGVNSQATGENAIALGVDSTSNARGSVAIGEESRSLGEGSVAIGRNADAQSNYSTSVGRYSQSASRGTAIGGDSQATDGATAVGVNSQATGENAVALGIDSSATAKNSVALGFNSVANEANTVSVGSSTNQRRITNVADGVKDFDAVNVRQLNGVRDEARAGIASALSLAPAALPEMGKTSLNLGFGTFAGEGALSANINHRLHTKNGSDLTIGFGISGNTNDDIAGRANIGIMF